MFKSFNNSLLIVLIASVLSACNFSALEEKTVRLGVSLSPQGTLLFVAMDQGYFAEEGLAVEPYFYPSGKRALIDGFLNGEVDYFDVGDAPFTHHAFDESNDLVALASLYLADNTNRIVARKDRGINSIADLEGKTIATQQNSAVHFFMHTVLLENQIDAHSATNIQFYPAEELPVRLIEGSIDAFSMREPFVSQALEGLGNNGITLSSPGSYVQSELLVASRQFVEADPEVAKRLLRALLKAEAFVRNNRSEAIAITATALKVERAKIEAVWDTLSFNVNLSESLLRQLSLLSDWIVQEVKVGASMPDLKARLMLEPLSEIDQSRVTVQ